MHEYGWIYKNKYSQNKNKYIFLAGNRNLYLAKINFMAKEKITGRLDETRILDKAFHSADPEFIAVYGRRRVGKTFLIREFYEDSICFELIGVHEASLKVQLSNFAQSLKAAMGIGIFPQAPGTWFDAFSHLEQFLESFNQKQNTGKRVVFIDELPWLNTPKSNFLAALEHFWNGYGSKQNNLILVVCGSAASWMIQKIVNSKGGLHNRLTRQIRLLPFTLSETESFLKSGALYLQGIKSFPFTWQWVEFHSTSGKRNQDFHLRRSSIKFAFRRTEY